MPGFLFLVPANVKLGYVYLLHLAGKMLRYGVHTQKNSINCTGCCFFKLLISKYVLR